MIEKKLTVFQGQLTQISIGLIVILLLIQFNASHLIDNSSTFLGISAYYWYVIAILLPFLHQVVIAPLWRSELLNQGMTKFFGSTERAFLVFKIIFLLFFIPRIFIALPLAILTRNTITSLFVIPAYIIGFILIPLILYGLYSVKTYFGITRAFGADHFFQEYHQLPLVKEGLFKYMDNAMYTIVVAVVWVPALLMLSLPGVIVGLFSHLFVWVHYFCIEKPDMDYIYGYSHIVFD